MRLVLDAHLSPALARWMTEQEEILASAVALRDLGMRDESDKFIFESLNDSADVILTKDIDFYNLVARLGTPPSVIWLRCGNRCNDDLKLILLNTLPAALDRIEKGDACVEINVERLD